MARPRTYRAQGVVLKRMDYGEADRIITLYTREHGKLRAIAKGVRRTKSRSAGHLEPFTAADLLLAVGRELDVVVEAQTAQTFRRVREYLELTTHGYYMVELVDQLTEERQENRSIYLALIEGLEALEQERDTRLAVLAFLTRLLKSQGFQPETGECVTCRSPLQPGLNQFSAHLGGALCPACGPREPSARPLPNEVLKLFRHLQRLSGQPTLNVPPTVSREAEYTLRDYAERIIERRLKTPALIARVQETAAPDL